MQAIAIIRVSGDAQDTARQVTSTDATITRLRRDHPTLTVLPSMNVRGVSGSDLTLTAEWRTQVLPAVASGAHVVVDSLDRLIRLDHRFDASALQALAEHRSMIHTPERSWDPNRPDDVMMISILAGIGGREKAEIARRSKAGREEMRARGQWAASKRNLPMGTSYDPETHRWGHNPDAPRVRQAFLDLLAGRSVRSIADDLGRTHTGANFILTNPIYRGWLVYDKETAPGKRRDDGKQPIGKKVLRDPEKVIRVQVYGLPGQEAPIIDADTFEAAQNRLRVINEAHRRLTRTAGTQWASTIARSAYELDLDLSAPTRHVLYARGHRYNCRCIHYAGKFPFCGLRTFAYGFLHDALDRYLVDLTTDVATLDSIRAQLAPPPETDATEIKRETLQRALNRIVRKLDNLLELRIEGEIDRDEYQKRKSKLEIEKAAQERDLSSLTRPPTVDLDAIAAAWTFDPSWDGGTKRDWLRRWVHGIGVSNEGIDWCVLRLPASSGTVVITSGGARTWVDLIGRGMRKYNPQR